MPNRLTTWAQVGARVAAARKRAGLTQQQIADRLGIDRTAVVRVEQGERQLDVLELAHLAETLGRSVEWFVTEPPQAILSYRRSLDGRPSMTALDDLLESVARDVEFLADIGELAPPERLEPAGPVTTVEDAEREAERTRVALTDVLDGPLLNLQAAAERVGLYAFSLPVPDGQDVDGGYVSLGTFGVAVVNGDKDAGRRRFNLAHELGHHVLEDEYSADFGLGRSRDDREKLIDAFAVHLLMPRALVRVRWEAHGGQHDPRNAAIHIASEFRVSWSAACNQLRNLELVDPSSREELMIRRPTEADYLELGIAFGEELLPPALPPAVSQAVLRAYRRHKIGTQRTVELLRGKVTVDDLPIPDDIPLDALRRDVRPHLER